MLHRLVGYQLQGGPSPRGPRFRLFCIEILLFLLHFVWAGGNLTERADQLVSNGGNNQIRVDKR